MLTGTIAPVAPLWEVLGFYQRHRVQSVVTVKRIK